MHFFKSLKAIFVFGLLSQYFLTAFSYGDQIQEIFTSIYDNKVWGQDSQGNGSSGEGSLPSHTQQYCDYLKKFLSEHKIKSVVDVGCGDWQFSKTIDWNGIQYYGYDVVESVVKNNQNNYGAPNIKFIHCNALTSDLPSADLFICKEVLQHLLNEDVIKLLPQLSKYKYCLITNDVDPGTLSSDNRDAQRGGWRTIDLSNPPFSVQGKPVLHYKTSIFTKQVFLITNNKL